MDMESDTVWRVVETKACARWGGRIVDVVTYIKNFEHLDCDPDINDDSCEVSLYDEVKEWHKLSRAELSLRSDLQPASGKMICIVYCNFHHPYTRPHSYWYLLACWLGMQDTQRTLEIYKEFLYPHMRELGLKYPVDDNVSPHSNDIIRQSHKDHGCNVNDTQKEEIRKLIEFQTQH